MIIGGATRKATEMLELVDCVTLVHCRIRPDPGSKPKGWITIWEHVATHITQW